MSKLIESTHEGDVLVNNGYMYLFDELSSDGKRRFWRFRNKNECKARVHTTVDDIEIIKSINEHTQDFEAAKLKEMWQLTVLNDVRLKPRNRHQMS